MKQNGDRVNRRGLDRLSWEIGKLGRVRFWYLATRVNVKALTAVFVLIACSISMVIMGFGAYLTSWPFIFPSLGPSTFLCFYSPSSSMAAPRNMILGHGMGAVVGFGIYRLSSVLIPPSVNGTLWLFLAPALALGIVGMLMVVTGVLHPPAASTTMIASMGLMPDWYAVLVVVGAVSMIAMQAWVMHRFAGIKYPIWRSHDDETHYITTVLGNVILEHSGEGEEEKPDPFAALSSQLATRRKVSSRNGKGD